MDFSDHVPDGVYEGLEYSLDVGVDVERLDYLKRGFDKHARNNDRDGIERLRKVIYEDSLRLLPKSIITVSRDSGLIRSKVPTEDEINSLYQSASNLAWILGNLINFRGGSDIMRSLNFDSFD